MAQRKEYQTLDQTTRPSPGKGSGRPRKIRGEESDRRQVWPGKERLWNEPVKSQA